METQQTAQLIPAQAKPWFGDGTLIDCLHNPDELSSTKIGYFNIEQVYIAREDMPQFQQLEAGAFGEEYVGKFDDEGYHNAGSDANQFRAWETINGKQYMLVGCGFIIK